MQSAEFYEILGNNIRTFRRLQKITQQTLADKLHKSLACISKYEKGTVAIDLLTVYEIARALNVSHEMLLPDEERSELSRRDSFHILPPFFQHSPIFFYVLRSSSKSVSANALEIRRDTLQATMYVDIKDFADYKNCRYILFGDTICNESNIRFYCNNPLLCGDFMFLGCRTMYLISDDRVEGCCTTLSSSYQFRYSRAIFSKTLFKDPDELVPALMMSKEDVNTAKKSGLFLI